MSSSRVRGRGWQQPLLLAWPHAHAPMRTHPMPFCTPVVFRGGGLVWPASCLLSPLPTTLARRPLPCPVRTQNPLHIPTHTPYYAPFPRLARGDETLRSAAAPHPLMTRVPTPCSLSLRRCECRRRRAAVARARGAGSSPVLSPQARRYPRHGCAPQHPLRDPTARHSTPTRSTPYSTPPYAVRDTPCVLPCAVLLRAFKYPRRTPPTTLPYARAKPHARARARPH